MKCIRSNCSQELIRLKTKHLYDSLEEINKCLETKYLKEFDEVIIDDIIAHALYGLENYYDYMHTSLSPILNIVKTIQGNEKIISFLYSFEYSLLLFFKVLY